MYIIPNSNEIILGCCLDDSKIYIYKEAEKTAVKFELSVVLLGHEDWVRSLAFKNDGMYFLCDLIDQQRLDLYCNYIYNYGL